MSIDKNAAGWYSYISIIGGILPPVKQTDKIRTDPLLPGWNLHHHGKGRYQDGIGEDL